MTMRQKFVILAVLTPLLVLTASVVWPPINWVFVVLVPIILIGLNDMFQTAHYMKITEECVKGFWPKRKRRTPEEMKASSVA